MKLVYGLAGAPIVIAGAAIMAMPAPARSPAATGAQAFAMCKACHTIEKGGRNGIGPNLYGVVGRAAGSAPGFRYSTAMQKSGLRWDEKTLDEFLAAPTKKVPGTRMPIGIADPAKRAAVIDYLKGAKAQ